MAPLYPTMLPRFSCKVESESDVSRPIIEFQREDNMLLFVSYFGPVYQKTRRVLQLCGTKRSRWIQGSYS